MRAQIKNNQSGNILGEMKHFFRRSEKFRDTVLCLHTLIFFLHFIKRFFFFGTKKLKTICKVEKSNRLSNDGEQQAGFFILQF